MTKRELLEKFERLEKKFNELEKRLVELERRPQTINHYHYYSYPYCYWTPPTITCASGSLDTNRDVNVGDWTFSSGPNQIR